MKNTHILISQTLEFLAKNDKREQSSKFLENTAKHIAALFNISYVFINKYSLKNPTIVETVVVLEKKRFLPNITYKLANTPCENVINKKICVYSNNLQTLFSKDTALKKMGAQSYIGVPLWSSLGEPIGLITIVHDKPILETKSIEINLQIIAIKVAQVLEKNLFKNKLELKIKDLEISNAKQKEAEERYKSLSEASFEAVFLSENGVGIAQNAAAQKMFGYSDDEIKGMKATTLIDKKDRELVYANIKSGNETAYEVTALRKNGTKFPAAIQARMTHYKGKIVRISAFNNLTVQKKLEVEAKKLKTAVEQSANTIVITNIHGVIEYVNPKFTEITGYTAEEAKGQNPRILKSGYQSKEYYQKMWETISAGNSWNGQFQNKSKSGTIFWEQVTITPIKNKLGNITNYLAVKEDITKRKKVQENLKITFDLLKESENYLSTILKTTNEGFWSVNVDNITTEVNPEMCKILGFKESDIIGVSVFEFVDSENAKILLAQQKKRAKGLTSKYEIELKNSKGENIPCLFKSTPIYNNNNKERIGSFALVTDISSIKHAYEITENQNQELTKLSFELSEKNRLLLESSSRFKNLFELSPVSIWEQDYSEVIKLLDKKKTETTDIKAYINQNPKFIEACVSKIKILNVNKVTKELFGIKNVQELKNHLQKTDNKIAFKALKKEILSMALGKTEFKYFTELANKNGETMKAIVNSAIIDNHGNAIASVIDITALKKAERKAKVSEQKFKELYEKSGDAILIIKNGIFIECNKSATSLLEYVSKEEFLNVHPSKLSPKKQLNGLNSLEEAEKMMSLALKNGTHRFEWIHLKSNGDEIPVEVLLTAITNEPTNKIIHCVWRDITERIKAEEEIRSLAKFPSENPNPILRINLEGILLYANKAAIKVFSDLKLQVGKISPKLLLNFTIEKGGTRTSKKNINYKNQIFSISNAYFLDSNYIDLYIEDITQQKNTEKALTIAKEKAEESDRLKTEFLNNMSHEIRTPMNGILGFSQMLAEHDLDADKQRNFVNIIQNSGHQLLQIIDDILEISRLGTKQVKVIEEEVSLNDTLIELFSIFDIKAKENKTPLYLKNGLSDVQSIIYTDKTKLNKIISNLLENALKFTNNGFIEFGYNLKNNTSSPSLEIYVKDTGIGIKPEKHELIFKRFEQAEKELTKKVGGLGLGLSIAKENTELLGGKITVESEMMKGATFFVTIPFKPVHKIIETTEEDNNYTILIAEDEEVNYMYLETILKDIMKLNCTILHAKNGRETIEICKNNAAIDIILMDLKMPVLNGLKATKQIRKFNAKLPIIAQTAYSTIEDKEEALAAGCNDFISKPIEKETLVNVINTFLIKEIC
ncbi:MAG: PAS domain S-box protein [Lutibacter sp.]|uniref:PAS domain S-box protein n=1 Tax=Lutibacter sp. TaxID=1925666 RepID=UPI00385EB23F